MPRPRGHSPGFEDRRQSIIDEAARLFARRGYAATGVSELCEEVGLGKGALYHYIGSKEKLLVEIQDRVLAPLLAQTDEINELPVSAMVKIRLLSRHLLSTILERLDHIWVYEHDYRYLSSENLVRVVGQRHQFETRVRKMLQEAMDDRDLAEADAQLAMLQFLNLHNHTYQWARVSLRWSAEELSATYYRTLMRGMGATSATLARVERDPLVKR